MTANVFRLGFSAAFGTFLCLYRKWLYKDTKLSVTSSARIEPRWCYNLVAATQNLPHVSMKHVGLLLRKNGCLQLSVVPLRKSNRKFFSGLCPPMFVYCTCTCYCVRWQKAVLSNRPFFSASCMGQEKMQAYVTPTNISAIKKQAAHVLAFCARAYTQHTGVCIHCTLAP